MYFSVHVVMLYAYQPRWLPILSENGATPTAYFIGYAKTVGAQTFETSGIFYND